MKRVFHISLILLLAGGCGLIKPAAAQSGPSFLQLIERDIQVIAEKLHSSVVTIQAITRSPSGSGQQPDAGRGSVLSTFIGSGIVLDTAGHILTTALVAEGRDRFLIELPDMRVYEATLVGKNPAADIAVLHTKAPNLTPPEWGDSDELRTGSIIVVLANSYGCPQSVSWGTINGFRPDGTAIQMNVAVSAGNSGGAVINSSGQIVGLVKAKVSEASQIPPLRVRQPENPTETWHLPSFRIELPTSGVALAVPINAALEVAERVIGGEGEDYPYLGIYVSDLHSVLAQYYHTDQGVVIGGVVENTPAEKYGLQRGDLIRSFNQIPVQTVRHFRKLIANTSPGDRVLFEILRGSSMAIKVKLVMGRAGTPSYFKEGQPARSPQEGSDSPLIPQGNDGLEVARGIDSMSIIRLNEIRRRILQSADSLGSTPVDHKINR